MTDGGTDIGMNDANDGCSCPAAAPHPSIFRQWRAQVVTTM